MCLYSIVINFMHIFSSFRSNASCTELYSIALYLQVINALFYGVNPFYFS